MVEVASDGISWDVGYVAEALSPLDEIISCILLSMTRVFREKLLVSRIISSALSIGEMAFQVIKGLACLRLPIISALRSWDGCFDQMGCHGM